MTHKYRPPPEARFAGSFTTCGSCGKAAYLAKAQAKRRAAQLYPGERMRFYRCGPWWHMTSQGAARAEFHRAAGAEAVAGDG